jgi:hypothetical protein
MSRNDDYQDTYQNPYLLGFEYSRTESDNGGFFHRDVENNFYRHPRHQGPPHDSQNEISDIYSLGIVLLEIGLWKTALDLYYQEAPEELSPFNASKRSWPDLECMQDWFISVAKKHLALCMGKKYQEAVIRCLSGEFKAKPGQPQFTMEFEEKVVNIVGLEGLQRA